MESEGVELSRSGTEASRRSGGVSKRPPGSARDDRNVATTEESKESDFGDNAGRTRRSNDVKKQYAVSTQWEREHEELKARRLESRNSMTCCSDPCTCSIEDFYSYCCCCARRRVGNMFFLMERQDGSPLLVVGPCWPFCTFVTLPLVFMVSGLVSYFVVLDFGDNFGMPWWLSLIYFPVLAMTLVTLFLVSCRDPGMLERVTDEEAGRSGWFWNEQTGSFRPSGAMYCRECKVLIQDYDHLCPWTGTGIGRGNMCAFKLFVGSVNILCYFSIALVAFCLIKGMT